MEPIKEKDLSRLRINKDSSTVSPSERSPAPLKLIIGILAGLLVVIVIGLFAGNSKDASSPAIIASLSNQVSSSASASKSELLGLTEFYLLGSMVIVTHLNAPINPTFSILY